LEGFELNLKDNLYKLWNRMCSGSYFPPPVRAVSIPKKSGGVRTLGIPTVADRVAQTVVKLVLEPEIEPFFLEDSYGYRPNKSALDAIRVTRQRCWQYEWVVEFDIKGLFDNIPHELLMKAVHKHTQNKWVLLYVERWLRAPMQQDGIEVARTCGTPQGGIVSPLLSNLFLHYVFDSWMERNFSGVPWCRYADDGLAHCRTASAAESLLHSLRKRFLGCGLELHPDKSKIIYCKDSNRKGEYTNTSFDFLGFNFRPREAMNKREGLRFVSFTPAASRQAMKLMRAKIKKCRLGRRTELSLNDISQICNPILQGWINYYGKFHLSALDPIFRHFNKALVKWSMCKYKSLRGHKTRAMDFLINKAKEMPTLFAHWNKGMTGAFS
jgi:RNA-directed DNA polymerase